MTISTAGTRWELRGWGYACTFLWAIQCTVALFLGIYLPFLLGNNMQHGETCRWFVLQRSGTCKGVASNPIQALHPKAPAAPSPHPESPRVPTPHPVVLSLSPVFFVTVRASNSYCKILANQSTMKHGNNLELYLEITTWIPHRHKKKNF